MKISPITSFYGTQYKKEQFKTPEKGYFSQNTGINFPGYNDYMLSFGARVDKGLDRFYETNKDRMPQTVKNYIESLDDKSKVSPLEAQQKSYELLEIAQSVEDIKNAYPDEQLFKDLINPLESRATRGILNSLKENDELLKLSGQGVLKDKSNLTVYLVKKVFLENKTVDEINQDLEKDLDDDFKADFKFKNKNSQYIYTTTLKALGIQPPEFEYRQSLRYTRDGYSDMVGEKISEGQRAFWNSLSTEERTSRAKVSAQKFEKWWASLTRSQILDMIADQKTELELLKEFKKFRRSEEKTAKTSQEKEPSAPQTRTKVGSNKLSQDELFIIWASNTLKIYQESLTEAEKDSLHIKRMQRLAQRWAEMSPAERTDYISKMKSGAEPLKYAMIDAWNHSFNIIKDLSLYLKQNQIYKPADLLYSTQEFSEFQSKIMTEFWENNPEYAKQLGSNIQHSQEKVQNAISRGVFEELKKEIMRDKNQRIKEMTSFKQEKPQIPAQSDSDYMTRFKDLYYKVNGAQLKNLPQEYINDYFQSTEEGFTKEQIEAWSRNLNGEILSDRDYELLNQISTTEPPLGKKINRAIEGALADTLYECTKDPQVYILSHSDLKVALAQIARGERKIQIISHKLNKGFEFDILKRKIDKNRIAFLYKQYKQDLSNETLETIASEYFVEKGKSSKESDYSSLIEYMKTYGKSLNIIFSDKSTFPSMAKAAMISKFALNMPAEIAKKYQFHILITKNEANPLEKEEELQKLKVKFANRFDFVPKNYMDIYTSKLGSVIRSSGMDDFEAIQQACTKRTDKTSMARLVILPKAGFRYIDAMKTLAMEEALADCLYEATGNIDVYNLQFEELCDNIELFRMVKKFPSEPRVFNVSSGGSMTLTALKRPNISRIQQDYTDYFSLIQNDVMNNNGTFEDLLFILNPDENMPQKDEAVTKRIKLYDLGLE